MKNEGFCVCFILVDCTAREPYAKYQAEGEEGIGTAQELKRQLVFVTKGQLVYGGDTFSMALWFLLAPFTPDISKENTLLKLPIPCARYGSMN